ncbi:MAG TPA: glycosyltransferase [Acidimicrobiales bacterium]|nr:glycosyltransferase [Acidimicrobiales bacterium]
MRALCTCVPGYGHFHPMVPVARALLRAGHEVAFATEERFCRRVRAAGFPAFPAGLGPGRVARRTMALPDLAEDPWRFGAQMFAGVAAPAKVPDLLGVVRQWRPDVVVSDVTDFAGPVAAASADVPHAAHSLGPLFPLELHRVGGELVAPLWHERGLPPPSLGGMFDAVYLDICPPSLQSPAIEEVRAAARPLRPVPFDAVPGETLPDWADDLAPWPTVYVTLGTLDNDAPEVFTAVVQGIRDEPVNVVVTVGPDGEPDQLGLQPPNVRVERYVPQSLLLPHCDVVVAHGGSGTTLAALAHGLPLLLLPQGANQFWNAERCADLGVGLRLLPPEVTPGAVRHAVHALLDDPAFRERAGDVQDEIARMPSPADVVPLLEELAQKG